MRNWCVVLGILLCVSPCYGEAARDRDENYSRAMEFAGERNYEKAVGSLMLYIEAHPGDGEAQQTLENFYEKFRAFQLEYLAGKELYNQELYNLAEARFDKALEIGYSEKLQYYMSELKKIRFRIRNTFLDTDVKVSGGTISIAWDASALTNAVITNAAVSVYRSGNLQLLNAMAYFNRNGLVVPSLRSYFPESDLLTNLEVSGTAAVISAVYPSASYVILITPHTPDGIFTQPVVELFASEPGPEDSARLVEPIALPELLAPPTNRTPLLAVLTVTDRASEIADRASFLATNADSSPVSPAPRARRAPFPWWWLLLLLALMYAVWRYRKWIADEFEAEGAAEAFEANVTMLYAVCREKAPAVPARKRSSRGKKLVLPAGLILLGSAFAAAVSPAVETGDALSAGFGRGAASYYEKLWPAEEMELTAYAQVLRFYNFDAGVQIPDYAEALRFVKDVADNYREIAADYYRNYDYLNFALNSFTVYYLDKDYEYFSKSVSRLREGNLERIAAQLEKLSASDEDEGRYLSALIRYTGYMAVAGSGIQAGTFDRLNRLSAEHRSDYSRYEPYYLVRRLNALILSDDPPAKKAVACYLEMDDYSKYFPVPQELKAWQAGLASIVSNNYRVMLYNELLDEGRKQYESGQYALSSRCYEYALRLISYPSNDALIRRNLSTIRSAVR